MNNKAIGLIQIEVLPYPVLWPQIVLLADICAVAGWSSLHTFIRFKILDCTPLWDPTLICVPLRYLTLPARHLPVCGGIGIDVPIASSHDAASSSLERGLHYVTYATRFPEWGHTPSLPHSKYPLVLPDK